MDANQAGLASEGFGISRPIDNIPGDDPANDWIPDGETLPQGWDDWGPFYTGQYGQLRGLDAMTVETCNQHRRQVRDQRRAAAAHRPPGRAARA